MCDIDKTLVLRGAAYMATYAAEREPPRIDQFSARLIEMALRAKLPNGHAEEPPKKKEHQYFLKHRSRQIYDFLESCGPAGASAAVVSKATGSKIGNVHYSLNLLIARGFVAVDDQNIYRCTGKVPADMTYDERRKVRPAVSGEGALGAAQKMLEAARKKGHPPPSLFQAKVLAVMLAEPGRVFRSAEIAKAAKCDGSEGKLFGALTRAIDAGLAVKRGSGLYQAKRGVE